MVQAVLLVVDQRNARRAPGGAAVRHQHAHWGGMGWGRALGAVSSSSCLASLDQVWEQCRSKAGPSSHTHTSPGPAPQMATQSPGPTSPSSQPHLQEETVIVDVRLSHDALAPEKQAPTAAAAVEESACRRLGCG